MTQIKNKEESVFNNSCEKNQEKNIMKGQKTIPKKNKIEQISFFQLFRFANSKDKIFMTLGGIASFINGLSLPMFCFIFGQLIDSFGKENNDDEMVEQARKQIYYILIIGVISFICSWLQMFGWIGAGERQSIQLRKEYFKAILKQDISWFDQIDPNQLATKIATETFAVQGAIGEKVPTFITNMTTFLGGFVVAFIFGWELALICIAFLPFLTLGSFCFTYMIQNADIKVSHIYEKASARSEQAIQGVKTVKSLNGQEHEQKHYLVSLKYAYSQALKWGIYIGISYGLMMCFFILDYVVALYFGSIFMENDYENQIKNRPYTAGDVTIVLFAIMNSAFSLGQGTPCIKNFSLGKLAAFKIYKILDAKPTISPSLHKGFEPSSLQGKIELKNVKFSYPAKNQQQILKGINLTVQPGQKIALVGESGCGKSTILQLIERFYDTDSGQVLLDSQDIKDINLSWYRKNIGYVGQEPVLFSGTIRENLLYGKPNASEKELENSLKQANAWDFVQNLDNKIDTLVGNNGSQLSGGQKQRICIARALLKNPGILLLDEATSALDRTNEKSIQKTLDEVSKNRTTIVVAHRLSTVQNSDLIFVIDNGQVIEQGNHQQLIQKQGKYFALSQNQLKAEQEEEEIKKFEIEGLKHVQEIKNHSQMRNKSSLQEQIITNQGISIKMPKNEEILEESEKQFQEKEKISKEKEKKQQKQLSSKLFQINKDERVFMFLGGICSFTAGTCYPVSAIFLGELLYILISYGYIPDEEFRKKRDENALGFIIIAIVSFISNCFQFASWKKVGEGLTFKLRKLGFQKILNMRASWLDEPENSPGTLSSRLGSDTQIVNGITSTVVNIQISNLGSLISGLCIGFIYEWRTTLVALGCFPLIAISGALQAKFVQGFSEQTDAGYKNSGNLIQEAVINMRTIISFGNQDAFVKSYDKRLELPEKIIKPKAHNAGFFFGLSQFLLFVTYGLVFFIGAVFVKEFGVDTKNMYIAVFAIMNAAVGAGNNNAFMTDIGQAYNAAKNLLNLLDEKDENQLHKEEIFDPISDFSKFKGEIEFKDVVFKYPTRNKYVLNGISFKISPGQKCALVGPSGCGKSTIMQILLRFYEIEAGSITIDGLDYKKYDIQGLRAQYGFVGQEPILFQGTIKENIIYNTQNTTQNQLDLVAEQANAKKFIENNEFEGEIDEKQNLGQGYNRQVGSKGNFLSGGQKQRIAIARAIIKQPKILLLDEATSALDNKNEQLVQQSLDKLMEGKTTLSIAHRISTIKDSDQIFVFEAGSIVEQGKYEDLIAKKGYFYRLERGDIK